MKKMHKKNQNKDEKSSILKIKKIKKCLQFEKSCDTMMCVVALIALKREVAALCGRLFRGANVKL